MFPRGNQYDGLDEPEVLVSLSHLGSYSYCIGHLPGLQRHQCWVHSYEGLDLRAVLVGVPPPCERRPRVRRWKGWMCRFRIPYPLGISSRVYRFSSVLGTRSKHVCRGESSFSLSVGFLGQPFGLSEEGLRHSQLPVGNLRKERIKGFSPLSSFDFSSFVCVLLDS